MVFYCLHGDILEGCLCCTGQLRSRFKEFRSSLHLVSIVSEDVIKSFLILLTVDLTELMRFLWLNNGWRRSKRGCTTTAPPPLSCCYTRCMMSPSPGSLINYRKQSAGAIWGLLVAVLQLHGADCSVQRGAVNVRRGEIWPNFNRVKLEFITHWCEYKHE